MFLKYSISDERTARRLTGRLFNGLFELPVNVPNDPYHTEY